jgi:hypothetical protein
MKRRLTILIAATALMLTLGCTAALAHDDWSMFRHDAERTGKAVDGSDGVFGAFRPTPIWVFPMPDTVFQEIDNSDGPDPAHPTYDFTQSGFDVATGPDVGFVGDDYTVAETNGEGDKKAEWRFVFPALKSGGSATCIISVWFPSRGDSLSLPPTEDAHYTVSINSVVNGPYIIDQTSGATWKQLPGTFTLTGGDVVIVRLTNLTEKTDENDVLIRSRVFADDLKIEAVEINQSGGTVIASPAVAVDNPIVVSCVTENGRGVVYGIGREKDSLGLGTAADDDRGKEIWRFPAADHDWIETGISSSPAIANIGGQEQAVVAGADGQIYCIPTAPTASLPAVNAHTYQGPGYLIDDSSMIVTGGWSDNDIITDAGYQGTGYKYIQAVPDKSPTATATWSWRLEASAIDRYYDVYAWIPPVGSRTYVSDAHYSDMDAANLVIPGTTTSIPQGYGGKWLKIRSRWVVPANPTQVTIGFQLTNETIGDTNNYVVADALKIVPYGIAMFDHSSPVVEGMNVYIGSVGDYKGKKIGKICRLRYDMWEPDWVYPTGTGVIGPVYASPALLGNKVYCASTDGHVYALDKVSGALMWMYPQSGQPLPEISSTTAVVDMAGTTYIYIATGAAWTAAPNPGTEGRVICIKDQANGDGTFTPIWVWTYPNAADVSLGVFKYASPLLMEPGSAGGTNPDIYLGSTDGQFYAIDGDPAASTTTETWRLNFAAAINSSAAGTFADYPDKAGTARGSAVPMAFLGAGSRIYGVELAKPVATGGTSGVADWWYDLLGDAHSSPALAKERIYIGDMAGHTWAFATGTDPGGGGGGAQEAWNSELGPLPPNTGSDPNKALGGRNSDPQIDVFTKEEWNIFKTTILEPAENGTPWFKSSDFRTKVRDYSAGRPDTYTYEWGEDIYIVVWNLLDPNRRYALQDQWRKPADLAAGGFTDDYPGTVEITIKSGAPGKDADSAETIKATGRDVDFFTDADDDPLYIYNSNPKDGFGCFYALKVYTLDGSSGSKSQTPGAQITISAIEKPISPDASSAVVFVPHDPTNPSTGLVDPQKFGINNPIGAVYAAPPGVYQSFNIGVETSGATTTTRRELVDAQVNGNGALGVPALWGGFTPHNKLSQTQTLTICDRSLLGVSGRKINQFRVERSDLEWNDVQGLPPINYIGNGLWEQLPVSRSTGWANTSDDYPDIPKGRLRCRMQGSGTDPSQGAVALRATIATTVPAAGVDWPIGANNANVAVEVPKFQPPNMPQDVTNLTQLQQTGYVSTAYAYVDTNGNGSFDKPGGLGIHALMQQNLSGVKAEAYRVLDVQVHVPADYRAEIQEQRINVGSVPQGFGYTAGSGGIPRLFEPSLMLNTAYGRVAPALDPVQGFWEWFKPFKAKNTGNVNLLNIGLYRPVEGGNPAWYWDLASDTVAPPERDLISSGSYSYWQWRPGTGYVLPYWCVISSLDSAFLTSPGYGPVAGLATRTFHKARVDENEGPELRIPDFRVTGGIPAVTPQLPTFSMAVPLTQPVGTYYGRLQLAETLKDGRVVPISNPVGVVVTVNEARLTGGDTLPGAPHLMHLEAASPAPTAAGMPAAFRNPATGNVMMFWASTRYGDTTRGGAASPSASDPWYLYTSKLEFDYQTTRYWRLSTAATSQWWSPTTTSNIFPAVSDVSGFFPPPVGSDPTRGALGDVMPSTVKFTSPSITYDKIYGDTWLFFTGQAYKDKGDGSMSSDQRRSLESRVYYSRIVNEAIGDVHSPSAYPAPGSPSITGDPPIRGDWTAAKLVPKGVVIVRDKNAEPELWSFWYGGGNGRWRIYYNVNPFIRTDSDYWKKWANEALLPMPKGLSSVSEPSPIVRCYDYPQNGKLETGPTFDLVYSAVSTFHNNSDIYMSRYITRVPPQPNKIGTWPVTLDVLPQRAKDIPEIPLVGERLTRDTSKGVWYSRDVDWEAVIVSTKNVTANKPLDFAVWVRLDPADPATVYQLNVGSWTKDPTTGAIVYTYDDAACVTLRELFRAVVINPVEGTVKFVRPPDGKALVAAQYTPRAYRLTTDSVADASPCAVMDDDANTRFWIGKTDGNPFINPSGWDIDIAPPTDRLWAFWRRPAMDKPGTGVYYKTLRYVVDLKLPVGLEVSQVSGQNIYTPMLTVEAVSTQPGNQLVMPVEVDWTKKRLYFSTLDSIDTDPATGQIYPKQVRITHTNLSGAAAEEIRYVTLAEEDMGQSGKTFGNLTSLMINEGQVSAFKDPLENKVWVFWTSTRSGNADVYYETISPTFYGRELK